MIASDGRNRDYTQANLHFALGGADTLRIEPVAAGRKSGLLNIVLGAVLIGAAFLLTGGALSGVAVSAFGTTITGSQMALVGGLLALSGVMSMLAPTMEQGTDENKDKSSAMINTPSNKTEPGLPVPIIYGRRVWIRTSSRPTGFGWKNSTMGNSTKPTLRSRATARVLDVISEADFGDCWTAISQLLNGTRLQATGGGYQFSGVRTKERKGTPTQDPIPGFGRVENEINDGRQIQSRFPDHVRYCR